MSESSEHISLVKTIYDYTKKIIPENKWCFIQSDSSETGRTERIGNYYPDVYYNNGDLCIVGEAKTAKDFERLHSDKQFQDYCNFCDLLPHKSMVIVCVPWELVPTAKNYFIRLKRKNNYTFDVIILNEVGWEAKV